MRIAIVLAVLAATACNQTSFKSSPGKRAADQVVTPPAEQKTLKLQCSADGTGTAQLVAEVKGDQRTKVRLEGEFCGIAPQAATGSLTVLFVVDTSGSMQDNDPGDGVSCGRLKAAEALVAKLEGMAQPGVDIKVGFLTFGDLASPAVGPLAIAGIKPLLTSDVLCSTYGGATNYESAFTEAKNTLSTVTGQKSVYLISDGMPTRSGTDPFSTQLGTDDEMQAILQAGQTAAEALRADTNVTLNAIFLGQAPSSIDPTVVGVQVDPEVYLAQITGDAQRVRLVTNADELAAQIVTLDTPDVVAIDSQSVSGKLTAASFGERQLTLASIAEDPNRKGVWTFVTEPFELYSASGKGVTNEVLFSVKTSDGKTYTATARLTMSVN